MIDGLTISNVASDLNGGAEVEIGDSIGRVIIGWEDLMEHPIAICQGAVIRDCQPGPPTEYQSFRAFSTSRPHTCNLRMLCDKRRQDLFSLIEAHRADLRGFRV
jgi:hypothetical protein